MECPHAKVKLCKKSLSSNNRLDLQSAPYSGNWLARWAKNQQETADFAIEMKAQT